MNYFIQLWAHSSSLSAYLFWEIFTIITNFACSPRKDSGGSDYLLNNTLRSSVDSGCLIFGAKCGIMGVY